MPKDCRKISHVVTAATKYIYEKFTGPFKAAYNPVRGLDKFEIKADRINAIRKKYEAFLEEDKKRKERNEFILGKLDKMRSCTTLVQHKYKSNHLGEMSNPTLHNHPVPLQERISGYSTHNPHIAQNQNLDLPRSENSILNEIANKFILIPKRYTNYDTRSVHTEPTTETDYTDWKSKYEILNELKRQETQSTERSAPDAKPSIRDVYLPKGKSQSTFNYNQNIPEKDVTKTEETSNLNKREEEHNQINTIPEQVNEFNANKNKFDSTYQNYVNAVPQNDILDEIDVTYDTTNVSEDLEAKRRIVGGVIPDEHHVEKEVKYTKIDRTDAPYPEPENVVFHRLNQPDTSDANDPFEIRRIKHPDNSDANVTLKPETDVTSLILDLDPKKAENIILDSEQVEAVKPQVSLARAYYQKIMVENSPANANTPIVQDTKPTGIDKVAVNESHEFTPYINKDDDDTLIANETYEITPDINETYNTPFQNEPYVNTSNIYDTNYNNLDDTYDNGLNYIKTSETSDVNHNQQDDTAILDNIEQHAVALDEGSDIKAFFSGPEGQVDLQGPGEGYNYDIQNDYQGQEQTYPVEINEHEETQHNYDPNYEMQYNMNTYDDGTYQQQGVYEQEAGQYEQQQQDPEQEQGYVQSQEYEQQIYEPDAYQQAGYEQYDHQQVYDDQQYQQENYETLQDVQQQLDKEEGILPQEEVQQEVINQVQSPQ